MSDSFMTLVSAAERDDRIAGLVLGGSRGKGLGTLRSDYDVYLVVADGVDPEAIETAVDYSDGIDLVGVWTVAAFVAYAIGDGNDWNRYNFAHLRPAVDKLGSLQGLCDAKEWLPADEARSTAEGLLDAYLNYRFRAAKNHADGNLDAAAMDAAETMFVMLDFIFTAERRACPYNKFLAWELSIHPLENDCGVAVQQPLYIDATASHGRYLLAGQVFQGSRASGAQVGAGRRSGLLASFGAGPDEVGQSLITPWPDCTRPP